MSIEMYLAFVAAAVIILVIPGPTILLVIGRAATCGRKSVAPLVGGVVLGDFSAMTLSLGGLGAILAASAAAFAFFKWIGAIYLFCLGVRLWRLKPEIETISRPCDNISARSLFRSSYVVTALNPKGIAFFGAFLPQFVRPGHPAGMQLLLLGTTFLVLAMINATLYAFFAGYLRDVMRQEKVRKWFNRLGGGALIGAGIMTAGLRRAA